jgi:hypothetical protein
MEIQLKGERFGIWQTFELITDFGGQHQETEAPKILPVV